MNHDANTSLRWHYSPAMTAGHAQDSSKTVFSPVCRDQMPAARSAACSVPAGSISCRTLVTEPDRDISRSVAGAAWVDRIASRATCSRFPWNGRRFCSAGPARWCPAGPAWWRRGQRQRDQRVGAAAVGTGPRQAGDAEKAIRG